MRIIRNAVSPTASDEKEKSAFDDDAATPSTKLG